MGYTHFWTLKEEARFWGKEQFSKAVQLAKKSISHTKVKLGNWDGTGKPVFTDDEICFNSAAEPCETFRIKFSPDEEEFNFCKTRENDYDYAVCVALLCFKEVYGDDFIIESDGNLQNKGWKKAYRLMDRLKRVKQS